MQKKQKMHEIRFFDELNELPYLRSRDIDQLFNKNNYWICACENCDHHFVEIHDVLERTRQEYNDS